VIRALLLILLVAACGSPKPPPAAPFESFAPGGDDVAEALAPAVGDWAVATGRDLRLADQGLPVLFVDQAFDDAGDPICAGTHISYLGEAFARVSLIEITWPPTSLCGSIEYTIRHEVGHAIARLPKSAPHAARGLMGPSAQGKDRDYSIDADALDWACSAQPCE
jgi:hypothetical protein